MILTLQELTAITKGCLSIRETDSGFLFQRMTDRQLAAVDHIERYRMRARFPAGVRLDFLTDASAISFDYNILEFDPNRDFFGIDLYVDDVMVHTLCEKPIAHKMGCFSCELGALIDGRTMRHIVLYLPISAIFAVSSVVLRDAARLERGPDEDGVLLCYGDSITQGYDALHPSLGYAAILARSLGLGLLNQAISGYVFDPATIDPAQVPTPRRVLVAYGTNDWTNKASLEEVRRDMDRYLDALVDAFPACRIDLILPIWRGDCQEVTAVGRFFQVLEALESSAQRRPRIHIWNGQLAVPHCTEFFADGSLHPNDTGMLLYAQWLLPRLKGDRS